MIVKHNVDIEKISWLHLPTIDMGKINNLFYPETIDEIIELCKDLQNKGASYFVFGHTSNCYFKSTFTPPHVVITSKLRRYDNNEDFVICECGAHMKQVARLMVEEGIEDYDGLWDLPGTVAAAVYGNAGCYGCEMSKIFESAELLTPQGEIKTITAKDLAFSRRFSNLKTGAIKGVILRVKLKKKKGDKELIKKRAQIAHSQRLKTQPGPQNNLGSCFMSGTKRMWYRIFLRFVALYKKWGHKEASSLNLELELLGHSELIPYLFDMNRFIWKDEKAIDAFDKYISLYNRLHKGAKLEINVFE